MKTLAVLGLAVAAAGCVVTSPPAEPSQCRAEEYRYLIGKDRSKIPAPPRGAVWRVTCTTCPMTMDHRPNRLNILYDQRSGKVREVRCG